MPDGSKGGGPHKVIYQCAEDDIADTIKPRLMTADADCSMVAFIQDDDRPLIAFAFDRSKGFRWLGPCKFDFDIEPPKETSKRDHAAQLLLRILEEGETESREIFRLMELEGISHRTIQTAKKNLNLEAIRKNGNWYWRIPSAITHSSEMESDHV